MGGSSQPSKLLPIPSPWIPGSRDLNSDNELKRSHVLALKRDKNLGGSGEYRILSCSLVTLYDLV